MPLITVTGLDHLVLTVTDPDQTACFYQRVLSMRPVTFGTERRALEFGTSKINLHQAGQEITPHAARPLPGGCRVRALLPIHRTSATQRPAGLRARARYSPSRWTLGRIVMRSAGYGPCELSARSKVLGIVINEYHRAA